jgi:hypothetical protein
MFSTEKGFAEYDALRSRLANSRRLALPGLMDWRGVIVDLTKTPLPHDMLLKLAGKVREVHAIARAWSPFTCFTDEHIATLVQMVERSPYQISKPRMVASFVASLLEIAEQNRGADLSQIFDRVFDQTVRALSARPQTNEWE